MRGLILSLFSDFDLFGRAFETVGWCVVRGPDTDICGWDVPSGRFDGVIGGPPPGDLVPEFERLALKARPAWWLLEQVVETPVPVVRSRTPRVEYLQELFLLSSRDSGDLQRRFTFGQIERSWATRPRCFLHQRLQLVRSNDQVQLMGEALANAITKWWRE